MMKIAFDRRSRRLFLVAGLGVLGLISTAAIALSATSSPGAGPLAGISAAQNAPVGVADPSAAATLASLKGRHSGPIAEQQVNQARLLGSRVAGRSLYLIPTENGDLCVYLHRVLEACTSPLESNHPASFSVVDPDGDGGAGPLVFGVAEDDVNSVSFTVSGVTKTVPVSDNVFAYQAAPAVDGNAITDASATFANGQSTSLEGSR